MNIVVVVGIKNMADFIFSREHPAKRMVYRMYIIYKQNVSGLLRPCIEK